MNCTLGPKVLILHSNEPAKHAEAVQRFASKTPPRPGEKGFDNPATEVGTSKWTGSDGKPIAVWYDPTSPVGQRQQLAQDVLARIDQLMQYNDQVFNVRGQGGNALVIPGQNGAYHYGCSFSDGGDWYLDDFGTSPSAPSAPGGLVFGLAQAEIVESYMGVQNAGWNCGGSGGESLSRVLAEIVSGGINGAMSGGLSARPSYDGSDWISKDQGTDQDYPSIACGMLYLDWMRSLGFPIEKIVQAGEPDGTLASNYAALTGKPKSQAFADFSAAVKAVNIQNPNPFNITDSPYPLGGGPVNPPAGNTITLTSQASGAVAVADVSGNVVGSGSAMASPGSYSQDASVPPVNLGVLTVGTTLKANVSASFGNGTITITPTQDLQPGTYNIIAGSGWHKVGEWSILMPFKNQFAAGDIQEVAAQRLQAAYASRSQKAVPWGPIIAFLEQLLQLLSGQLGSLCPAKPPAEMIAQAKARTWWAYRAARVAFRRAAGPGWRSVPPELEYWTAIESTLDVAGGSKIVPTPTVAEFTDFQGAANKIQQD